MKAGPTLLLFVAIGGAISFESQAQTNRLREPIHLDTYRYRISLPFKPPALLTEEEKERLIAPIRQSFDPEGHEIVTSTDAVMHPRAIHVLSVPQYKKSTLFELSPATYPWQLHRQYFPK